MLILIGAIVILLQFMLISYRQNRILLDQNNLLLWQRDQLSVLGAGVSADPILRKSLEQSDWRIKGIEHLLEQILLYVINRTKANAVALMVRDLSASREVAFKTIGLETDRAVQYVKEEFTKFTFKEEPRSLESFGIKERVLKHATFQGKLGIKIWAGFASSRAPTRVDEDILQELARIVLTEISYARELSQLVDSARQQELMPVVDSKVDMLAQFSHDIRSPLHNVRSILNLLKLDNLRDESAQFVDIALANCVGVEAIVDDVIDVARVRAGRLTSKAEYFILSELLSDIVESHSVTAKMKGVELNADLNKRYKVFVDKNQMRRVFTNLISNALKFTKYGHVTVSADYKETTGKVSIKITDTGRGMTEDEQKQLFKPFVKLERESAGFGLGLSIVHELVRENKGEISVNSIFGKGSEFTVVLSAEIVDTKGDIDIQLRNLESHSARILLIDDDIDYLRSSAKLFERDGYQVFQASRVDEAMAIINFKGADLIISDSEMPGGGGKELISFISSKGLAIPTIIVSGDSTSKNTYQALGAVAVLEKPCAYKSLKELVDNIIHITPVAKSA